MSANCEFVYVIEWHWVSSDFIIVVCLQLPLGNYRLIHVYNMYDVVYYCYEVQVSV